MQTSNRKTYLLIDGENLDATLGSSILSGRPNPEQRPRWERLLEWSQEHWEQEVIGLFFLNATNGSLPMSFVQALMAIGFQPIPLSGSIHEKVVDIGISRTLQALLPRDGDVILGSHDGDFAEDLENLVDGRRIAVVGFREFISSSLSKLADDGVEVVDLEYEVGAFNVHLPRLRIIPLEEFDPIPFL